METIALTMTSSKAGIGKKVFFCQENLSLFSSGTILNGLCTQVFRKGYARMGGVNSRALKGS